MYRLRLRLPAAACMAAALIAGCGTLIGVDDLDFSSSASGGAGQGGVASVAATGGMATTSSVGGVGGRRETTSTGAPTSSSTSAGGGGAGGGGVASIEICDGLDNDMDGAMDEGCPDAVVVPMGSYAGHTEFGTPWASPFADGCEQGMAMFEITGWVSSAIHAVAGKCAIMELDVDKTGPTYSYSVKRGSDDEMLPRGGSGSGMPYSLQCPDESFIVGITLGHINVDGPFDSLAIHCAEFSIVKNGGTFELAVSLVSTEEVGTTMSPISDNLSAPRVMDRYRGTALGTLESFGIGSTQPTLQLIQQ